MKKSLLTILGLSSGLGILQIIYGIFGYFATGDSDGLEVSMFIAIPVLFSFIMFYKILKDPEYFEKYKLSFKIFGYGIITGLSLGIAEFLIEIIFFPGEGFLGLTSLIIFIFILIISLIVSIVSLSITFFKNR